MAFIELTRGKLRSDVIHKSNVKINFISKQSVNYGNNKQFTYNLTILIGKDLAEKN